MALQPHPVRITPLVESRFGLDGGAMFGIIPQPLWSKTNPPDERNRIAMTGRCALITFSDDTHALIDVGLGQRFSDKERDLYALRDQDDGLTASLAAHNLTPGDINHVILTHLHFDHAGGLRGPDAPDGAPRARFHNATHWVQRRNWSWGHSPSARDQGSYRLDDFAFLARADAPPLQLVDDVAEILPGVEVLPMHGHTFGMQVVKITTPSGVALFTADLIPTSSHLRDPYVMGYDLQPLITVQEKRALLHEAMRHDWTLLFSHDPERASARVERDARDQPRAVPDDAP